MSSWLQNWTCIGNSKKRLADRLRDKKLTIYAYIDSESTSNTVFSICCFNRWNKTKKWMIMQNSMLLIGVMTNYVWGQSWMCSEEVQLVCTLWDQSHMHIHPNLLWFVPLEQIHRESNGFVQ
jgi:hypothetical protein